MIYPLVIELNYEQLLILFTVILEKPGMVVTFIVNNLTKLVLVKPFQEEKRDLFS